MIYDFKTWIGILNTDLDLYSKASFYAIIVSQKNVA